MTEEKNVYDRWGRFVVTRSPQPSFEFAVLYRDETSSSSTLRTAKPEELPLLLRHYEDEPEDGEHADLVEYLRRHAP